MKLKIDLETTLLEPGQTAVLPNLMINQGSAVIEFRQGPGSTDDVLVLAVQLASGTPQPILADMLQKIGKMLEQPGEES